MSIGGRVFIASGLVAFAALAASFLGIQVTRCTGPLGGRTTAEAIRDGCISPSVGPGMPILALAFIAAAMLIAPSLLRATRASPVRSVGWAAMGALDGLVAYWFLRPTSFTGPTTAGETITVPLPLDVWALITAGIAGAGIGWLLGLWLGRRLQVTMLGAALANASSFGIMAG